MTTESSVASNQSSTLNSANDFPLPTATTQHHHPDHEKATAPQSLSSKVNRTNSYLLSGALAGLMADALVHPLDTLRARLQTQRTILPASSNLIHPTAAIPSSTLSPPSATQLFFRIIRREGVRSLYRGFGAVAVGTIPGHALYFAGYELSKSTLVTARPHGEVVDVTAILACGLVADVCGSIAWTPMDVIKQRLQVISTSPSSSTSINNATNEWQVLKTILKEDGVFGLYRGFGVGLLTYGPYVSLYFVFYEQLKASLLSFYSPQSKSNEFSRTTAAPAAVEADSSTSVAPLTQLSFPTTMSVAAFSSGLSAFLTCPLDVVKTRIQVQRSNHLEYSSVLNAIDSIFKKEGIWAFFNGLKPRMLWMSAGTALTMAFYEEFKQLHLPSH